MSNTPITLSVIVPTLNEVDNVTPLVERIDDSLSAANIAYEIVFVDDHSNDGTYTKIKALSKTYPIRVFKKHGKRGKAYSILEGVDHAEASVLCMIDADLQYPPEAIAEMFQKLHDTGADIALSSRIDHDTPIMRKLASKVFNIVFIKLLFGMDYDTQSGLKVFRNHVFSDMNLKPSPWSFDLEFVVESLLREHAIVSHNISFDKRRHGEAKINLRKASYELAKAAVMLRTRVSRRRVRRAYVSNMSRLSKVKPGNSMALLAMLPVAIAVIVDGLA